MEQNPRRKTTAVFFTEKKNMRLEHPAKIIYCAGSSNKGVKRFWKRKSGMFTPPKTNMAIWHTSLGGGNLNICLFSSRFIWGRWTHFDGWIFFKWGWFNHRPDHQKRAPALTQSTESLEGSNDALHIVGYARVIGAWPPFVASRLAVEMAARHFRRNQCSFLEKCYLEIELLWWFFGCVGKKHSTIQNLYWSDVPPHFWYTSIEI